jgi:DNA polymerase III delta subunit
MLYLFTGNNPFRISEEVSRWKEAYKVKFWEENVHHYKSLETADISKIKESCLSQGLFTQNRLVILDGYPFSSDTSYAGSEAFESSFTEIIEKIPEEIIVVCAGSNPDKRKSGYKILSKLAQIKDLSLSGDSEILDLLQQKFPKQRREILSSILQRKWWSYEKSLWELEKLSLAFDEISKDHVEKYVSQEYEESIFSFVDFLLQKNTSKVFSQFDFLLTSSNYYAVFASILANIRTFLYVEYLRQLWKNNADILDILSMWNRTFLLQKRYGANFQEISSLYWELLDLDQKMKTWKLSSSEEDYLIRQMKKCFLKFVS